MKKFFPLIAVCAFLAAFSSSAQANGLAYCPDYSPQTVILKGTISDDFNFDVTATARDATNCFAWENQKKTLDLFLVICYYGVDCERCPITLAPSDANPTGVYAFLVDRKEKTVFYGEVPPFAVSMICMGENNVGLQIDMFTPDGLLNAVAAGKRDCKYGLLKFDGVYADFDYAPPFSPFPCRVANYVRSGEITLRRDDAMTRKALGSSNKWCPECIPAGCDSAVALLTDYIEKRFKDIEKSPHGYVYVPWFTNG